MATLLTIPPPATPAAIPPAAARRGPGAASSVAAPTVLRRSRRRGARRRRPRPHLRARGRPRLPAGSLLLRRRTRPRGRSLPAATRPRPPPRPRHPPPGRLPARRPLPAAAWPPHAPGGAWSPPPPTGGAWPPPGFIPPAPPRKKAPLLISLGALALVLVLLAGVGFYVGTRKDGPHYPKEWDARVLDIVSFDENERGLTFKHPVEIEFMTEDDFKAQVTTSDADLSDDDKAKIEQFEASFRALGLIGGDVDLFKSENDIQGGGTLAYYSPEDKKVRVRGTELDVGHQGHAGPRADPRAAGPVLRPVPSRGHGDRRRGHRVPGARRGRCHRGRERLHRPALRRPTRPPTTTRTPTQAETADYGDDPQVLVATFTSPYILGPPFVEALKAKGGNNAINDALQNPPASEAALLDIFTFLDHTVPVDGPGGRRCPTAREQLDDGDFGATTWYLMLAQRIDVHEAVKAVDGWAGDSLPHVQGGRAVGSASRRATRARPRPTPTRCTPDLKDWLCGGPPTSGSSVEPTGQLRRAHLVRPGLVLHAEGRRPVDGGHPAARSAAAGRERGVQGERARRRWPSARRTG